MSLGTTVAAVVAGLLLAGGWPGGSDPEAPAARGAAAEASEQVDQLAAALPLRFEANEGQVDDEVRFLTRRPDYTVFFTANEAVFALSDGSDSDDDPSGAAGASPPHVVRMSLAGADADPTVEGLDLAKGGTHYLRGSARDSWVTDVASYRQVAYRDVYPGVDLVYREADGQLKYDLVVEPGADPDRIGLQLRGHDDLAVDEDGDLVVSTPAGELRHDRPVVYQEADGDREEVAARYTVDDGVVGFEIAQHDPDRQLVIDPALTYSSYLGGTGFDQGQGVAADGEGATYVTGYTPADDFPTTDGAYEEDGPAGSSDAFVVKLDADGELAYSTYLGGTSGDQGADVAVDGQGRAHVAGQTASDDFPATGGAAQTDRAGVDSAVADAFVARLSSDGSGLEYATFLGGSAEDLGFGIALGTDDTAVDDTAVVVGQTVSPDFPADPDAAQGVQPASGMNGFVAKLAADGSEFEYVTYVGGLGVDVARGVVVDDDATAVVAGQTAADNFPVTDDAYQSEREGIGNDHDAFVVRVAEDGSEFEYATYLGGGGIDIAFGAGAAGDGSLYLAGSTTSDDFPTANPAQEDHGAQHTAFVSRIDTDGDLAFSTYLGGPGWDRANDLDVRGGDAYVTGMTDSGDFPLVDPMADYAGNFDVFVSRLNAAGELVFSTYLGGTGGDRGRGIAVDGGGTIHLTGQTQFADDFPTVDPVQPERGGGNSDGYVARIAPDEPGVPLVTGLSPAGGPTSGGATVEIEGRDLDGATQVRFGDEPAADFTVDSGEQITAIAPAHEAGAVPVTVTSGNGTSPANPITEYVFGAGQWSVGEPMSETRFDHTATLLADGRVLVAGGRDSHGDYETLASAEVYDPVTGEWSETESMATPRFGHTATSLPDGRVLVAGGFHELTSSAYTASTEIYDPADDSWTEADSLNVARALHVAERLADGRVLVAGGRADQSNTAELYDPDTGTWTSTDTLEDDRHTTGAVRLDDGRVLVAGGFGGPLRSAEAFDPDTETWETLDAMEGERARSLPVLLPNGEAMYVAGWDGVARPDAERYDPDADEWSFTSNLGHGRWNFTGALLSTGEVLVAGGGVGGVTSEVYDPTEGSWRSAGELHTVRGGSSSLANTTEAVLLSSDPHAFAVDSDVCGDHCGKVLVTGNSHRTITELYTPQPVVDEISPSTGPANGGTEVTITGAGLYSVEEVRFGGTAASEVTVDSDARLTAVAPSGEVDETVEVTVRTHGGRSEPVTAARFTYGPPEDEPFDDESPEDGLPLAVDDLAAEARSETSIELTWSAPDDGTGSPASRFHVHQSREPITDLDDFGDAFELCDGQCRDTPAEVGDSLSLTVTGLPSGTEHHYALRAIGADGEPGPLSNPASATTHGDPVDGDGDDDVAASEPASVQRVSGATRIHTAAQLSRFAFGDGADTAVLARAGEFPDALTAAGLAAEVDAPVLLTFSGELHDVARAELARLGADTVYLVGGDEALSPAVERAVADETGEVIRLDGRTRFHTAALVAREVTAHGGPVDLAVVARGDDFADALAAGVLSGTGRAPVLLTPTDRLVAETVDALDDVMAGTDVLIAGGEAAVSARVDQQLRDAGYAVDRAAGAERYATAAELARLAMSHGASNRTVLLASGRDFPDALAAAPAANALGGSLLLVDPERLGWSAATADHLRAHASAVRLAVLAGGSEAISDGVAREVVELLGR